MAGATLNIDSMVLANEVIVTLSIKDRYIKYERPNLALIQLSFICCMYFTVITLTVRNAPLQQRFSIVAYDSSVQ